MVVRREMDGESQIAMRDRRKKVMKNFLGIAW